VGGPATVAGAKLGRYQIVKHLASGGMAEVLLARATGIEGFTRHVVIKRIRPGQAKDKGFVQMFLNEARLAAQLHHANIVQVHDIGQEGNEYFFAMEYVHGEDLRRLLTQLARHKQKLPVEHIVTIISAAAVALHHAHEQRGPDRKPLGIVHRDVTPANILVGYDGNVKVVDFGIAKAAAKKTDETQAGTLKGKASYMSPEQCTGEKVDRRSDVFALGIVLYELITTRRLFKAENDFLTMSAIVGGKVPHPKDHRPDLPDALEAIVMKALALKAEDRYQTADEMREALEQFAISAGLRTSTSALAAFLKQQFGERPEPWLVDDDDVEMEIVVDFDGSASALVSPPEESIHQLAIPQSVEALNSSPIVKARTKAITTQSPPVQQVAAAPPKKPLPLQPGGKPGKPLTAQIPVMSQAVPTDKSRPFRIETGAVPAAPPPRVKPKTVKIPAAAQTAGAAAGMKRADGSGGLPGVAAAKAADASAAPRVKLDQSDSGATTFVSDSPEAVDATWDVSRRIEVLAAGGALAGSSPDPSKPDDAAIAAAAQIVQPTSTARPAPKPGVEAKPSTARPDATPTPVEAKPSTARPDATPKPAGQVKTPPRADQAPTPAGVDAKKPLRADQPPQPAAAKQPAPAGQTAKPVGASTSAPADRAPSKVDKPTAADANSSGASASAASRKTPPTAFAKLSGAAPTPLASATAKPGVAKPDAKGDPKPAAPPDAAATGNAAPVATKPEESKSEVTPLPPVLPKPPDAPKTWSLAELASIDKKVDKHDQSTTSKFDTASLSSSRTDASSLPVAAAPAAAAVAAADTAADADKAKRPGTDGRDSAPSLPPPPVGRKSVRLPGVAQVPEDESGGIAKKFGAPNVFGARAKTPSSPESWPGGTASIKTPSLFARLVRSPKQLAMGAGALVLLVVVIVFATGSKSTPSPAPAKPASVTPAPAEPAPIVEPPPVDDGSATEPGETANTDGSASVPPVKPAVKKPPPKRVATQPAVKPTTKPAVKPTTKPGVKPVTKKPPTKKWDPNTLFPSRK
jgi:serine/threonine protein kinase